MSRRISTKKYGKKTRKSRKSRKTRKNKKVYLGKKQFGSGPVDLDIISNIYLNLECQEAIRQISSLDKNAVNSLNWQELNNNLTINVTDEVHLENAECSLCSMVTNENQRNYCKEFYNKCKLLNLYKRFIGEYNNEQIGVDVLRNIMRETIPRNDVVNIQNFLIQLGANFTEIRDNAFANRNLTTVTIPNSVTRINYRAFANNQLTSVTIPNLVEIIGTDAFSNNQLTSVTIPNSVREIGNRAFSNNLLRNVTIPNSVNYIAVRAFANNNQLTSVTVPSRYRGTNMLSMVFSNEMDIEITYTDTNLTTKPRIPVPAAPRLLN